MSGGAPCRKWPPPVRSGRAVPDKAAWCTERVFESALYQRRHPGVPNEAEECDSDSEIGDFAENNHLHIAYYGYL